jgi:hypothetical protein
MPSPESSTVSVTPAASVKAETVTLPSAAVLDGVGYQDWQNAPDTGCVGAYSPILP